MVSLSSKRSPLTAPTATTTCPQHQKIALPILEGYLFQAVAEIALLTAESNYTCLHLTSGKKILVCKTLRSLESLLYPFSQFVRVHRSYIVNLHLVEKYIRGKGGQVILQDGRSVSVSNGRKADFLKALERYYGQPL